MKNLLIFLLVLIVVVPARAQKVKPALNLTKGNTYYMISSANSEIIQIINGQGNKVYLSLTSKIAFKVTDVLDSIYNMEVSYQSLYMKTHTANGDIEMDSKKTDIHDIPSKAIVAMINKPFNITMTRTGKVRSIENVENLINSVFKGFARIDSVKASQLKSQFVQSFGAKAFKGNLEIATAIFPEESVRKYRKWIHATKLESMMSANLQTTYQLLDATDDYYLIHGVGVIATDDNGDATSINGLPVKYYLTGTVVSDIKADRATGWVKELKLKEMMKGDFEIQDNPKIPGGMTIPITISNYQITTDK